ncbi:MULTISPECIES: glycosyltransferase [Methylosinus]|uniref:glycosyltransferase n=1 Tax=Methylosinus TaxID=425 RepID=UPI0012DD8950|nr:MULTISPECIES: glycosyltransferase [Methylosinus]
MLTPVSRDRKSYFRILWQLPDFQAILASISPETTAWLELNVSSWEPASQPPAWIGLVSTIAGSAKYNLVTRIWQASSTSPELAGPFRFGVAGGVTGDSFALCAHVETLDAPLLISHPRLRKLEETTRIVTPPALVGDRLSSEAAGKLDEASPDAIDGESLAREAAARAHDPDHFDFSDIRVSADGTISLIVGSSSSATPRFAICDAGGETREAEPATSKGPAHLNLLRTSDRVASWRLVEPQSKTVLGVNFRPQWSIEGEDTFYIRVIDAESEEPSVTARFFDPATGRHVPIEPMRNYVFSLLMSAHRCAGEVQISILDKFGGISSFHTKSVDRQMKGGTDRAFYSELRIPFVTPADACWLSISVVKSRRDPTIVSATIDSFLFFADPVLTHEEREQLPARVSLAMLTSLRQNAGYSAKQFEIAGAAPEGAFDLLLAEPRALTIAKGLMRPRTLPVTVASLSLFDSLVQAAGTLDGAVEAPSLIAFVDGRESCKLEVQLTDKTFFARGKLKPRHRDGRRHLLDVRCETSREVLAARRVSIDLPEDGGVWGKQAADAEAAARRTASELELLRGQAQDAKRALGAASGLHERIAQLAPIVNALAADFGLMERAGLSTRAADVRSSAKKRSGASPEEALLVASPLFDEAWYAKMYMSRDKSGLSPAAHYLERGVAERLFPHPLFDAEWYRERYMSTKSAEPPFVHFLREGVKREYVAHPLFDPAWFARRYQRKGLVDCMIFFQKFAFECGLDPHPLFDSKWYGETYPKTFREGRIGVHDYMETGAQRGRWPNPLFDPAYYVRTYKEQIEPGTNPLAHFIEQGSDDGLNPNPLFSSAWYRAVNPGVAAENWIPLAHYLHVGGKLGLDPNLSFSTKSYLAENPDLDLAKESALAHALRKRSGRGESTLSTETRPQWKKAPLASSERQSRRDVALPSVNWVIGPPDNIQWAYGNNAKRFIENMPRWSHAVSGSAAADIVLYFDVIVAERFAVPGHRKIIRIGGARPIDRLYGDDPERLRKGLAPFEAVIALSPSLLRRVSEVHPNAVLIPNGLDLDLWKPAAREADRPFTAGVAASAKSNAERDVKGIDIAIAAAERAGVALLRTHKGPDQIPHDRMIEDFYSKIDVLLHPVAPGREGSSNVIMEALAMGVPVITTASAGFHGELLQDGVDAFIRSRDVAEIAEAILALRDHADLAERVRDNARRFALEHHDIGKIAERYEAVFRDALVRGGAQPSPRVGFFPFWKPTPAFASSRLRSDFPAALLEQAPTPLAISSEGSTDVDVALVVQSAEDPLYAALSENPRIFVVYDVCDRYFENPKVFKTPSGEVNSLERFNELIARANVVIAPTVELKAELARRFPRKPVYLVPEMIDYSRGFRDASPVEPKRVIWFGSPQRGNFDSARWLLDSLTTRLGYEPRIVSRKSYFSRMPEHAPHVVDWSIDTFLGELQAASICVVSHAEEEKTKSPNRFITAVAHGVPTVVSSSRPSAQLLRRAGCEWAIVSNEEELDVAARRLENPDERRQYLQKVQAAIEAEHGNAAVRGAYLQLFLNRVHDTGRAERRRVAYVTHNLNYGEGAPKSLFELAVGLRDHANIEPFVYCAAPGDLASSYAEAEVALHTFTDEARPPMRVLNQSFEAVRRDFISFLRDNQIDYVVANTIKSAPFVTFADEEDIPASIIIRESFEKANRFNYYLPPVQEAAERALLCARSVVFVSANTMRYWADQPMTPDIRLIKNGVNVAPFEAALALDKAEARQRLGIEADLLAVCVGTINERKGQLELARWYQTLPSHIRERLTIMFVGATEGGGLDRFRAEYDALPPEIRKKLLIVSTTPDIGLYYRASDLFLMNSSQESYPRSTMEALLFGLPVISTPVFGVLEQVVNGENGMIFPFEDMIAWRQAIERLVADPRLLAEMSENAASSFWKLTTYAEMLNDYRSVVAPLVPSAADAAPASSDAVEADAVVEPVEMAPVS